MNAEWAMVIITAIYVLATILICWSNYKSLRAAQEQVKEMKKEYDENNRPKVDVELHFFERAVYCLRLVNNGKKIAKNVRINIDDTFISSLEESSLNDKTMGELLKRQSEKVCIIGVGQKHDVFVASVSYKNFSSKVPIGGTVSYECSGEKYSEEFYVDLDNYMNFFSSKTDEDKLLELIKKQNSILNEIEQMQRLKQKSKDGKLMLDE